MGPAYPAPNQGPHPESVASGFTNFRMGEKRADLYTHYVHRGPRLKDFCLYEYSCQINVLPNDRASKSRSFPFDPQHPQFKTYRQQEMLQPRDSFEGDGMYVPAIYGAITAQRRNPLEDGTLGDDDSIENDICECLLAVFVPWDRLQELFADYASDRVRFPLPRDACSHIWHSIFSTLPSHIQVLARNFRNLRRSKDEAERDRLAQGLDMDGWEDSAGDNILLQDDENEQAASDFLNNEAFDQGIRELLQHWREEKAPLGGSCGPEIKGPFLVPSIPENQNKLGQKWNHH